MAAGKSPTPFQVQQLIDNPKAFEHHSSVSALWNKKWRTACSMGVYPFVDGKVEDFDPIFKQLIEMSGDDTAILYDPDSYAAPFLPVGEDLVGRAGTAESEGKLAEAKELYLRAGAVYRIARFPINRSRLSRQAWEAGKAAYLKGGKYLDPPNREVMIPFVHADKDVGDEMKDIPAYLRIPNGRKREHGWPVLLFICGLDAYRTDHTNRTDAHIKAGFATLSVEIPGTGDSPVARNDPESPDRLWSSVLDWICTNKDQYGFDDKKVVARGVSTGGYYAFRIAHTHADRLLASVGQGGWSHHMLEPTWIRAMNHMEYPFALTDAIAFKFGYENVEEFIASEPKARFSLEDNGNILDRPSCRLFVVNGLMDSIFPIEDSILVATRGRVKDVRFMEGKGHMGNPGAEQIIIDWINEVVAGNETDRKTFKP
jgi:pimeloyl-ACP methyl ester carboxylesterase